MRTSVRRWKAPAAKALAGALIGVLYAFYFAPRVPDVESFLVLSMGGFAVGESGFTLEILFAFLPPFVQLLLYGGYLREDLDAARAYIFTRTHRRSRWLWGKLRGLLLAGLAYWMALLGGGTACALLLGVPVHAAGSLLAAFWALLCTVAAYGCLLTLVLNLLTIRAPLGNALVGVVVLDLLFRFALNDLALGAGVVGRLLPTTQAVLAAHDIPALCALQPLYFEGSLAGFTPLFSLAVTAAYSTACGLCGRRLLNRTEL